MRTVALVDDHELLKLGLKAQLLDRGIEAVLAPMGTVARIVDFVAEHAPLVVLLDLGLPTDGGGVALVEPLRDVGASVLVLTGETDVELWAQCLERGALGVVGKSESLELILDAVERALEGEPINSRQRDAVFSEARAARSRDAELVRPFEALSPRERTVLVGLIEGWSVKDLANRDFVGVDTVRSQVKSLLRKLGVNSQLEAVAMARFAQWPRNEESLN